MGEKSVTESIDPAHDLLQQGMRAEKERKHEVKSWKNNR